MSARIWRSAICVMIYLQELLKASDENQTRHKHARVMNIISSNLRGMKFGFPALEIY